MEIKEFIESLEKSNFSLAVEDGKLLLQGDKKKLTRDEIQAIKSNVFVTNYIREHKNAIVEFVNSTAKKNPAKKPKDIASIYRLSGLQQGMLFHGLYSGSDAYVEQFSCDFLDFDVTIFKKSWDFIVSAHSILRSSFNHNELKVPVQVVHNKVDLPLEVIDLTGIGELEQAESIKGFEERDRNTGFDFKVAPLMRITLMHLNEGRYRMVWTWHHILLDGWSMPILMQEFLSTYDILKSGKEVKAREEDRYEDYIRYIERRDKVQEQQHWQTYMAGVEQSTLLPFIKVSSDRTKGVGSYKSVFLEFDEVRTSKVEGYAQGNRITVNTLMQGVWSYLLHRYTGNTEVAFGVIVSGRPDDLPNVEHRVGLYINTLPLHSQMQEDQPVVEWLQKLQSEQVAARQYQHTPLQDIQEITGVKGSLFDTVLVFENYPVNELLASKQWGLRVENVKLREHNNFPLSVEIATTKQIRIHFNFNSTLLDEHLVHDISVHFEKVLLSFIDKSEVVLRDVNLVSEAQQRQILFDFNNTSTDYPVGASIVEVFEAQVAKTPGATAVVFEDRQLSYQELNERANQLAHYLQSKGVQAERCVALCIERSVEMMVAILAILKAGGAYVPVDVDYPAERIQFMVQDTAAPLLITTGHSSQKLPSLPGVEIIEIDQEWAEISKQSKEKVQTEVTALNLAYIIYTSGSTGKPKGVMVEHGNVVSLVKGVQYVSLTHKDVLLSTGSPSFDATTFEYWGMLLNGGQLVLCTENRLLDSKLLKEEIRSRQVTTMWFTSSWFNQLVETDITVFEGLQTILAGGEKLSEVHIEKVRQQYPSIQIINGYGPTENTTFSLTYSIAETALTGNIPIGCPLSNRTAYIVDERRQPMPVGVSGEICVGGAGLSRGYLNRPELTAEKFITNPFSKEEGSRLYRTGDLGRWLPDGNIEYLGRKDEQVKIRGYRIELGEIENVLLQSGLVSQAVVLAKADANGNKRLVGYVVGEDAFDKQGINTYLNERLPEYMVPALWVELESLPLTSNGKVDKRALPEPDASELSTSQYVAPQTEFEKTLVAIWQELLDIEQVGITDNFFELGGDSLLAIRLVSGIRKQLQVDVAINVIFEHATIEELARQIEEDTKGLLLPAIEAKRRPDHIPLSFSQERLWFIDQLEGSLQYHVPILMKLKGKLNKAALAFAFQNIIARHEVLRTAFNEEDGKPYQFVQSEVNWQLQENDGSRYKNDLEGLRQHIKPFITAPFDLSKDYMIRTTLISLDGDEYMLVVTIHHIAADAWSMPILIKEVVEFYKAYEEKRAAHLNALKIQYADYAIWQRQHITEDVLNKKLTYWKDKLQGVTPLQLPTDFVRPPVLSGKGASQSFAIDRELSEQLQSLSKQNSTTLFVTMLSAFKVLLHLYSGQKDVCVGTPISNRTQQEVEDLIGFFLNTLAIRSDVTNELSFVQLLQKVKETTLQAFENQEVPFEKVVDAVVTKRDLNRNPLFQVMFVLVTAQDLSQLKVGEVSFSREPFEHTTSQFDITFSLTQTPSGIQGIVDYSIDLYTQETIGRMILHFTRLLQSVVNAPQKKIGKLTILTKEEEYQLLREFNNTDIAYPEQKSVVDFFKEQASKEPDNIAVVFNGTQLTYSELDKKTNQLAAYLRRYGVKEETIVPISIERSLEMIIGVLGILKAGGTYMPIDPDYPIERIQYILEDVAGGVILSSKKSKSILPIKPGTEIIELDSDWSGIDREPTDEILVETKPNHLVYIIYTSGSTGRPKGVKMTGGGMVNLLNWQQKQFENKKRRVLQYASLNFDVSFQDIFSTLCFGSSLYLIDEEERKDIAAVAANVGKLKITHLFVPYIVLKNLSEYIASAAGYTSYLEEVIVAGEQLKLTDDIKRFVADNNIKLVNQYGPTEAHVVSSYNVRPDEISVLPPIGKPIDNTYLYILNEELKPVPIGVQGELFIGGVQVASGYLNRPELTAEKFLIDAFSSRQDAKMYKTGDLAKWLPDGNIEYLGRVDDQVKIRGYRIELGEVESILHECHLVRQVVVLAKDDTSGNKRLVGYLVPQGQFDKDALVAYAKTKLPDYMVPAVWVELQRLPVTANGKVDKTALSSIDISDLISAGYVGPRNEIETGIASIWQDLLKVEKVGVYDNFFELGGHSLLATRTVSAIRKKLQVEIAIKDLFLYSTVAELAQHISAQNEPATISALQIQTRPAHIPLSFSQERLWFINQLDGSVEYHLSTILRLKGSLNQDGLEFAFQNIINRHEVLRTVFLEEDGKVYQHILDSDSWKLKVDDSVAGNDENKIKHYLKRLANIPFDLSKDHLIRSTLITVDEQEFILLVTMHHIVSDAWSMPIIVKEISELYTSFIKKRQPHLPPLPLQYADYSIWQRNYLQGEVLNEKLDYWKNKLEDVTPLQLPTDFTRPATKNKEGASINFQIDKAAVSAVNQLSKQQGSSLFMTLLAAFKVLLFKYSGQKDICVGTSIAGRQQHEIEDLVGFFVNTLALRSEVNEGISFKEFLSQVKNTTIEGYQHQEVPFEKVVDAVVKERDPSRTPVFQSMLVLLNTPEAAQADLGDLKLSREAMEGGVSKFDITFFFAETANGLQAAVEYSTNLFTSATIFKMVEHYQQLLHSIVSNPDQKVSELNMLAEEEVRELQTFNRDAVAYPKEKTVVTLFEAQAARTPGAPAVVSEGEVLSYKELNERSNRLAHYLRQRGVREDQAIPMCIERGAGMMVAMLGILKAGAGYVPIDTDFPSDRISYMLEDTAAAIVVSSKASSLKLPQGSAEVIQIDGGALDSQPVHNPTTGLQPHHLAYVIYTSGSTGQPKGVMIEHRNLVDYVFGLNQKVQIDQCKSYALVSTIATDLGNTVIYSSLLLGGALHVFSKEAVSNIEHLHEYFSAHRIDCLKIVPSHFKALSNEGALLLPKKLLVFGGEALPSEVVEDIRASGNHCRIVNHYGPTETTIGKLLHVVDRSATYNNTIPIGKPFSNTRVYVLSKTLQLCPIGVPGQLYIAGDGVARGYLNNADLTAAKFVEDPFDKQGQSLMYATGDQVKYLDKGEIEFIGRIDNQVKIRGYRVEPGEIESMLQQCRGVRQGVVIAGKDKQGNNRLTGYIVPEGEFDREEIISQLKEKLPEYMIPAVLVELQSVPLTPNGKVDRKALPDPEAGEELGDQYVAPRNEAEEQLARIWQDVLEVEQVGVHDDFFELGGHSLLAVRLISAIRKAFKVEMPISHVFDYPTVALLAGQLESQSTNVLPPIEVLQPRPEQIPLSFSQERLWFIDKLEGSVQYHVPAVLGLKGRLHTAALQFALKKIVNRHEVLRTVFIEQDGHASQQVKDNDQWQLSRIDGSKYKDDPKGLQQYIQEIISKPFDLSKDDMLRAALITLSEEEHVLVVTLHHIASDGWSRSILVKEVAALYAAFEENRPVQLAPLPVQYADYALWQRQYLQGEVLESKLQYWKDKLQDTEPLQLPTDYTRPAVQTTKGAIEGFNINKEIADSLQQLSSRYDTTLFMTLLAAFKVLLYNYSQQEDICVGTPIAGRHQQELEGLIGFFVNTLALRSEVSGQATFKELLQQVRNTTLEAYEHQDIPFEKVVEAVVKQRDLSRSPLFQVMFVMRNTPDVPDLQIRNLNLSAEGYEHSTAMFDLIVYITETPNGLHTAIEYSTDLYNSDTITRMFVHFSQILKAVTQAPEQKIGLLPMLASEEHQILTQFNNTKADFPREKTIKDLFEEQVQKTPDSIALIFEDQQLTYAELNKRANKLAVYLKDKGVKQETLVPICIERSFDMIIGVMGILKAGGVYVPIDPEYPAERIKYMLEDTKSFVVVTNRANVSSLPLDESVEVVDIASAEIAACAEIDLETTVLPENLAYLLYTSGSTGLPKGVMMPHRNLVNLLWWQEGQFENKKRKVLQFASLNFDVSFQEIFSTLCFGSSLFLISGDRRKDMYEVLNDVGHYGLTHLFVPFLILKNFAELLNSVPFDGLSLEEVVVAGEQLKLTEDIQNIIKNSNVKIINQYGPTEAHVVSSYTISKNSNLFPLPPIGKPVNNTYIQIINRDGQLSPIGVPGEIRIGGVQVARGYLNKPELTADKFVADTSSVSYGMRLYKTGDLGRWLPNGNLEYLGRLDDQVKIRGYRIELGEIESILQQSNLVKQAVVLALDDKIGNKRLVGYVVAQEVFDKDGIVSYLKGKLPNYMVPSLFVDVESLKVTRNGKVDKKALPQVNLSDLMGAKYEAARNETELALAEIWQDLLKVDRVGIHDNFFELGGHSLLVIKLVSSIKKRFLLSVPIPVLFQFPTIIELGSYLDWEQNALQEEDTTEFEEINI